MAAAVVALFAGAGRASAAEAPAAAASGAVATTLSDDELAGQRGGFVWGGMTINLGAEIRSYVDGKLIVRTNLVWGDTGASVERTVFADGSDGVVGDAANGMLAVGGVQPGVGDGVMVFANQGRTVFIQAAGGSLRSLVLNTANGTNLRQEMDVTINIANFAPVRRAALAAQIGMSLNSLIRR